MLKKKKRTDVDILLHEIMDELMDILWRRRPCIFHSVFILWIAAFIKISDACSSRSIPKIRSPPSVTTVAPPIPPTLPVPAGQEGQFPELETTTPNFTIPHYDCPAAYQKWYCLNSATCFSVRIGDTILYNCRCPEGFMGQRCEYKDTDESYGYVRQQRIVKTASIAGGVTLGVIVIVVLIIAVTTYLRRKKAKASTTNGNVITPEQLERSPFGRVQSRAQNFKLGSRWTPTTPTGAVSLTVRRPAEQEALLSKLEPPTPSRRAPKASISDVSLCGMDPPGAENNDFRITVNPVQHPSPRVHNNNTTVRDVSDFSPGRPPP